MPTRRDRQRWSLWSDFDYGEQFGVLTLGWIVGVGFLICILAGSGGYATSIESHDTAAAARAGLQKAVNTADDPQQIATGLLLLNDRKIATAINDGADTNQHRGEILTALGVTARTGAPLVIDSRPTGWGPYWSDWFPIWMALFLGGYSIALFILYVYVTDYHGHYLADLPWRDVWPIVFVALTPVGVPFYIVSAIALRNVPAYTPPRNPYHDMYGYYATPPRERTPEVRKASDVVFGNEPQSARQFYTQLRLHGGKRLILQKRDRLRDSVKTHEQDLRRLGEQTRDLGKTRAAEMAELKRVEELAQAKDETRALDTIDAEFTSIMALNGVTAARVINNCLSVRINVRVPFAGIRYDFGDWEVRVTTDGAYTLKRLRSGVRNSWTGGYPDYSFESGGFCLGDRERAIRNNFAKGQTLEGLELVSATLHSVNHGDKAKIPLAFRKDKG